MKIKGELKELLDKWIDKVLEENGYKNEDVKNMSNAWQTLHAADNLYYRNLPEEERKRGVNIRMVHIVYKTCNDSHISTYLKRKFHLT